MSARTGSFFILIATVAVVAAAPAIGGPTATVFVLDTTTTTGLDWVEPALSNFGSTFGWDASMGLLIPDWTDPGNPSWEPYDFGGGTGDWFADWSTVSALIPSLAQIGSSVVDVDGLNGIVTALMDTATYPRIGFGTNVVLITDGGVSAMPWGDQDVEGALAFRAAANMGAPGTFEGFTALNVIIDHGFTDGSGTAMGVRGDSAFVADGAGDFIGTGGATLVPPTTGATYAELGREHGSAWDMTQAQFAPADPALDSFAKGFRSVKIGEFGDFWLNGGYSFPPPGPTNPVPEPGTWLLMGVGAVLLMTRRRQASRRGDSRTTSARC